MSFPRSVSPLLREEGYASVAPVSLASRVSPLRGGERINTTWPREHLQLHGLACDGAGTFASVGRFGLFTARLAVAQPARLAIRK